MQTRRKRKKQQRPTKTARRKSAVKSGPKSSVRFPGESRIYRAARERLLAAEVEMRRAEEQLAALRRKLPPGGRVPEDYVFAERGPDGGTRPVRLSELFSDGKESLLIYSLHVWTGDGAPMPILLLAPGWSQWNGAAYHAARQLRGGREIAAAAHPRVRPAARLAQPAPAVFARQLLQPRLPRRACRMGDRCRC